jgi:hypothetical protein
LNQFPQPSNIPAYVLDERQAEWVGKLAWSNQVPLWQHGLTDGTLQLGSKLVQVERSVRTTAWMIDYDALEPWKRCLIDNGDLLNQEEDDYPMKQERWLKWR